MTPTTTPLSFCRRRRSGSIWIYFIRKINEKVRPKTKNACTQYTGAWETKNRVVLWATEEMIYSILICLFIFFYDRYFFLRKRRVGVARKRDFVRFPRTKAQTTTTVRKFSPLPSRDDDTSGTVDETSFSHRVINTHEYEDGIRET